MNITDIFAETRDLCSASSTDYSDAALLRRVNNSMETVVSKIIRTDGNWQFDDETFTTHPIGYTDLIAGQQDYTFDEAFLDVHSVSVLDKDGNYIVLQPLDRSQMGVDPDEFHETNGMPMYYDKLGGALFLYPAPAAANITTTNGLKVYFQRTASLFTAGDISTGTKVPGFMSPYHVILAYMSAVPYCMKYKPERVALYEKKIAEIEDDMLARYAHRAKDEPTRIIPRYRSAA